MLSRKQAFISCCEYIFCLGGVLRMNKTTETIGNKTVVNFSIYKKNTSKPFLTGLTLDDCVSYVQTRIPEAFMAGYQDGIDAYEELHDLTEKEIKIHQAIELLNGLLSALRRN